MTAVEVERMLRRAAGFERDAVEASKRGQAEHAKVLMDLSGNLRRDALKLQLYISTKRRK